MTITIALSTLILILFVVWLALSILRGETAATQFWWNLLIAIAVLVTFGRPLLA